MSVKPRKPLGQKWTREQAEWYVAQAYRIAHFDRAVAELGVPPSTLYTWLKRHGYRLRDGLIYHP